MRSANIHVKRWFDKQNGNSYYNFRIHIFGDDQEDVIIPAPYDMDYGYGSHPFYVARDLLKKTQHFDNNMTINEIDYGYVLQRDMKSLNK